MKHAFAIFAIILAAAIIMAMAPAEPQGYAYEIPHVEVIYID